MTRRVVVTGMGVITPVGLDVSSMWRNLLDGRSGAAPITLFDPSGLETRFAAEAHGFDPLNYLDRKEARRTDRYVQFALAATQEALRGAELQIDDSIADDVGVLVGSGIGGIATLSEQFEVLRSKGPGRVSPFLIPAMITNMAAGQIAIAHNARGINFCATSACASGAHAIGEAAEMIRRGAAKAMIAGGVEAPVTPIAMAGFNSARTLSTRNDDPAAASRPFDAGRDGFVIGEGAGIVILEDLEFALQRGARVLAELLGYGATCDAYHVTAPHEQGFGIARAIRLALRQAELAPEDVGYINAHGTSTALNDAIETRAIKAVFGEHAARLAVSSTKSQMGHLIGAAGAVEAIVCVQALQQQLLPPTINYQQPDPQCDLDYVPNQARPATLHAAISNSLGFGGHNTALLFQRYQEQ